MSREQRTWTDPQLRRLSACTMLLPRSGRAPGPGSEMQEGDTRCRVYGFSLHTTPLSSLFASPIHNQNPGADQQ
jgi:hypothetical protein